MGRPIWYSKGRPQLLGNSGVPGTHFHLRGHSDDANLLHLHVLVSRQAEDEEAGAELVGVPHC